MGSWRWWRFSVRSGSRRGRPSHNSRRRRPRNPPYVNWAAFKPGTTVTRRERVSFGKGSDETEYYVGARVQEHTYKLLEVTPKQVVVQMTLVEHGPESLTEHAPMKITYPATAHKSRVLHGRENIENFKEGEEDVKLLDKMVKARFVEIMDIDGDATIERKMWHSDKVPGGMIKEVKVTKKGKNVSTETLIQVTELHVEK